MSLLGCKQWKAATLYMQITWVGAMERVGGSAESERYKCSARPSKQRHFQLHTCLTRMFGGGAIQTPPTHATGAPKPCAQWAFDLRATDQPLGGQTRL